MPIIFNTPNTKYNRRKLRLVLPEPEQRLWHHLRARRFYDLKFRRQYAIGMYIVDFYCPAMQIVIEIDGDSHYDDIAEERDAKRSAYLEAQGCYILRFTNMDVMKNTEGVLRRVAEHVHLTRDA